jgi:SRSO17 transposase
LIDRAVYLPVSWTGDRARCAAAGLADDVTFATKITLGRRTLERALDAGVPTAWATADEFYGGDRGPPRDLQARTLGYVLAVAKNDRVNVGGLHGIARGDHIASTPGQTGLEPLQRRRRSQRTPRLRLGLDCGDSTRE